MFTSEEQKGREGVVKSEQILIDYSNMEIKIYGQLKID